MLRWRTFLCDGHVCALRCADDDGGDDGGYGGWWTSDELDVGIAARAAPAAQIREARSAARDER